MKKAKHATHMTRRKKSFRRSNQFFLILLGIVGVFLVLINFHLIDISNLTPTHQSAVTPVYEKPTARISLLPETSAHSPLAVKPYTPFDIQLQIDPANHKISVVHPIIMYDSSILKVISINVNNREFPADLQKVDMSKSGILEFSAGINLPLDNAVTQTTTVATIRMEALKATSSPTPISFNKATTALSISPLDPPSGNVIAIMNPLYVDVK